MSKTRAQCACTSVSSRFERVLGRVNSVSKVSSRTGTACRPALVPPSGRGVNSSAEVKNAWSCNVTPSYIFITWRGVDVPSGPKRQFVLCPFLVSLTEEPWASCIDYRTISPLGSLRACRDVSQSTCRVVLFADFHGVLTKMGAINLMEQSLWEADSHSARQQINPLL
jgi:hypothetical protein